MINIINVYIGESYIRLLYEECIPTQQMKGNGIDGGNTGRSVFGNSRKI